MSPGEAVITIICALVGTIITSGSVAIGVTWRIGRELERLKTKIEGLEARAIAIEAEARAERQEGNALWRSTERTMGTLLGILQGRQSTPGE